MKHDIRQKLKMKENPEIVISDDVIISVSTDAMGLLQAMETLQKGDDLSVSDVNDVLEVLYSSEDIEKLKSLKLNFEDFITVLRESITIATGGDTDEKN